MALHSNVQFGGLRKVCETHQEMALLTTVAIPWIRLFVSQPIDGAAND